MFSKIKHRISDLMDTMSEYLEVLPKMRETSSAVSDCLAAVEIIQSRLDAEEEVPAQSLNRLQKVREGFRLYRDPSQIHPESLERLMKHVRLLKETFEEEVKGKLNVVFLPYKASMWDSLATVYEAARRDENCVAKVVPIPYYQLSQNEAIPTYEGERFPDDVPITHYNDYDLASEEPDMIFVHNVYDQYNTLTRVHEMFYTTNLKKYTDMLVYVPYHVSSFIVPKEGVESLAYSLPTIANIDKIILVGEFLKKTAIRDGVPAEKLLVLGSPKLDVMVKAMQDEGAHPEAWMNKIQGKTVYVVNTGCLFFAAQPFQALEWLLDTFSISRLVDDAVVIWRPHPLTLISIMKYTPHFLEFYVDLTEKRIKGGDQLYNNIILDESDDYLPALKAADVLISTDGSLLRSYLLTEKKVLYWGESLPEESLLPPNVFYFAFNRSEPWYEVVKKFSAGYDPLAENRKGMAAKVYANADGTSGEKVYLAIKECVLEQRRG
ncbi:hypothetical protein ACF3MZ_21105 [Paenibacillaceae bacterium WGS1546]|uniref:hypothetical protein n=1 Tax=Cohnella sp. WGS1546 TaxID=3366810 RepID=UPI00372CFCEC